ncbi:MAG TPA: hypothetical protein EYG73_00195 [Arcobacter sp.]|nr:hypothetical protein [Arcobacter sp.]
MQKDLQRTVNDLKSNLQEQSDALYKLKKKDSHVRYSSEMNSSIFEMLAEIGLLVSNVYKRRRIEKPIENIKRAMHEKVPILEEIESEVSRIKKQYEKSLDLNENTEGLNTELNTFIKIRMLYEQLDNLSISYPQYKNIVNDFQSKLLEPDIKADEIKSYTYVEVEKIENESDQKMFSSLFEALISEVFKDEATEASSSSTVSNQSVLIETEENVNLKRDVQRYRR